MMSLALGACASVAPSTEPSTEPLSAFDPDACGSCPAIEGTLDDDPGPSAARRLRALETRRVARFTRYVPPPRARSPEETARVARHCPFSAPRLEAAAEIGPTVFVARDGYVLEHGAVDKVPLWVCERVAREDLGRVAKRRDRFSPDPQLQAHPRAELLDYVGSGYDRGHLAPAANRSADQRLMDETFFLSNMAPQLHAVNAGPWGRVEAWVRKRASAGDVLQVVSGALFWDEAEDDAATADGLVPVQVIGAGGVSVPTHFFKIVVGRDRRGALRAVAFVVANVAPEGAQALAAYVQSIDWIEVRAGLDVLPELTSAEEASLEREAQPLW
jgi:endonuclease G